MRRGPAAEEKDDEARMQSILFKINTILFIGTVIAIRAGKYSCFISNLELIFLNKFFISLKLLLL